MKQDKPLWLEFEEISTLKRLKVIVSITLLVGAIMIGVAWHILRTIAALIS